MIVIDVLWLENVEPERRKTVRIEKQDFKDAAEHAEILMARPDVLGLQITWEKSR